MATKSVRPPGRKISATPPPTEAGTADKADKALLALLRWWGGITREIDAVAAKLRSPKGPLRAALGEAEAGETAHALGLIVEDLDRNRPCDAHLTTAELLAELKELEGGAA